MQVSSVYSRFFKKTGVKLAVLALAGSLMACSSDSDNDDDDTPNTTDYKFSLSAKQVLAIPSIASSASASATITVDNDTKDLSGSVVMSGISPSVAHIHFGAIGENGAPLVTLVQDDNDSNRYNIPDNTVLSQTEYDTLVDGGFYVNVHSAAFPNGEIRGQVVPSNHSIIVSEADSDQVVGSVESDAAAKLYLDLNQDSGEIQAKLQLSGVTASNAHIHSGFAGNNGDVVVAFTQSSDPEFWDITAKTLTQQQVDELLAGGQYVNVHSQAYPGGEVRGQITPDSINVIQVALSASPNVVTDATGTGYITLDTESYDLNATVIVSGLTVTNMHIHTDADGSVVKGFTESEDNLIWKIENETLTSAQASDLLDGMYYINVHTQANSTGELRAQIE